MHVLVTGSDGLIGSTAVRHFSQRGDYVLGTDCNARERFFGPDASTAETQRMLSAIPGYHRVEADIRDGPTIEQLVRDYRFDLQLVIHTAAQPSHDWAATQPHDDFSTNANGALNLLESVRKHAPHASVIYCSTNKVYGDAVNSLPLIQTGIRYDLPVGHRSYSGVDESASIDQTQHSLFGVSKTAGDLLFQEYGRYFGLNTAVFRLGCVTGAWHAATSQHGFLAYLAKCLAEARPYRVIGYGGLQVRDVIHAEDVICAFAMYGDDPRPGAVYNLGGGRSNSTSILEMVETIKSRMTVSSGLEFDSVARRGDHRWWITNNERFMSHYPAWSLTRSLDDILDDLLTSR